MSSIAVLLSLPIFVAAGLQELNVRSGEDAPLQCQDPGEGSIILIEWSRSDLRSEGYVFFFRNNRPYENYQHEFFKGRVKLRDPSMKDRDVSVILRNVSTTDTGTYECEVTSRDKGSPNADFKHSVNLTVAASDENTKAEGHKDGGDKDGGDKDGADVVTIVLVTVGVVVVLGLITVISCRRRSLRPNRDPVEQTAALNT